MLFNFDRLLRTSKDKRIGLRLLKNLREIFAKGAPKFENPFDKYSSGGGVVNNLYKISIVYSVISTISKVISNINQVFYNAKGDLVPEEDITGHLKTFLLFPNPSQRREDFIELASIHYDFYGEIDVEIDKENYRADILIPRQLSRPSDFDTMGRYIYRERGGSRYIHKDNIVRIINPSPSGSKIGFSPLSSVEEALTIIKYFNRNMSDKHRQNLFIDGVLEFEGYNDLNNLREMTVLFSEVLKESRVPAVSGKFKAIDLSKTIEANIKLQDSIEISVFRAFNVQPIIMGKSDIQKATAFVQASLFKSLCLRPRTIKLTRLMNEIIFKIFAPFQSIRFEFDLANYVILADAKEEAEIRKSDFEIGIYTSNELREIRGLPAHADGNYLKPFYYPQMDQSEKVFGEWVDKKSKDPKRKLVANESLDTRFACRNSQRIKMFSDFNKAFSDIKDPLLKYFDQYVIPKGAKKEAILKALEDKTSDLDAEVIIVITEILVSAYTEGLSYLPKSMGRLFRFFNLSENTASHIITGANEMFVDPVHFSDMGKDIVDYMRDIVRKGVEDGAGSQEIARLLKKKIDSNFGARAQTIARTESGKMVAYSAYNATKEAGYKKIMWITSSAEPRDYHRAMDGKVVGIDEGFQMPPDSPDAFMQYPHDPSASAGNVVNCLCDFIEVPDEEGGDSTAEDFAEYLAINE